MDHQKCYVFTPQEQPERPAKRRRVEPPTLDQSWQARERTYHELWGKQQQRIETVIQDANQSVRSEILDFVTSTPEDGERIPTGLVVAGPSIASHGAFFESLGQQFKDSADGPRIYVCLTANEAPNLKALLKAFIRKAFRLQQRSGDRDDVLLSAALKKSRLLDYDLDLLLHLKNDIDELTSIVLVLQDSEAFEASLLADFIALLSSWIDGAPMVMGRRFPIHILFGIATSIDNFHDHLPRSVLRCLQGKHFDLVQGEEVLEQVFWSAVESENSNLWLGPGLCRMLIERQKDQLQSVNDFVDALKYAYMAHFFANPLSTLLQEGLEFPSIPQDLFEGIRNLPSFRAHAEGLLNDGETKAIRRLLNNDKELFRHATQAIARGQRKLKETADAVNIFASLRSFFAKGQDMSKSTLYIKAAAGELIESPMLRELLLSVKRATSDILQPLLVELKRHPICKGALELINDIQVELESLISNTAGDSAPLRSEHDLRNDTLRTTVVAQKVELSKQKSTLSKQDAAYSRVLGDFCQWLETYFQDYLINPQELFLHEAFLYDIKAPHREVFMPKPSFVVERALSCPHDYLHCDCCETAGDGAETLSPTQPATAIVYQLYLESGSLLNVSDLWSAFNAVLGGEEDEEIEQRNKALFQRALAELRYLGFIRQSRKKTDHVAKVSWRGL